MERRAAKNQRRVLLYEVEKWSREFGTVFLESGGTGWDGKAKTIDLYYGSHEGCIYIFITI